jgi:hypothetical protein
MGVFLSTYFKAYLGRTILNCIFGSFACTKGIKEEGQSPFVQLRSWVVCSYAKAHV